MNTLDKLGLGTWRMGEDASARRREVAAVREALDIGYRLIDSAEMYGEGGAEEVVGTALQDALRAGLARGGVCVVSKVYPHNASAAGVVAACDRSRRRLQVDTIDLYLLHWRGGVPLAETVRGFEQLLARGRIARWGVSNFDTDDLAELDAVPGGSACAANQVYYSLKARGAGFDLLPAMQQRALPLMAYTPIDRGARGVHAALAPIAQRHGISPTQVALAWVLQQPGVTAIPKAVQSSHLRANWDAQGIVLTDADLAEIDRAFPPPRRKQPLAMT